MATRAVHGESHSKGLDGYKAVQLLNLAKDPVKSLSINHCGLLQGDKLHDGKLQGSMEGVLLLDDVLDISAEGSDVNGGIAGEASCGHRQRECGAES
jgi:hypothetical protein